MMMTMAKGKGASEAQDWLLLNSEVATLQSPFFKDPFYCQRMYSLPSTDLSKEI